jgi:hypothetical protein
MASPRARDHPWLRPRARPQVRAECASESAALRAELAELRAVLDRQLAHAGVAEAAARARETESGQPAEPPAPAAALAEDREPEAAPAEDGGQWECAKGCGFVGAFRVVADHEGRHTALGGAYPDGGSTVPQMSPPTQQPSPPAGQPQPKRKRGKDGAGLMVWLSPRRKRDKRAKRVDYKQLAAPVWAREPDVNT